MGPDKYRYVCRFYPYQIWETLNVPWRIKTFVMKSDGHKKQKLPGWIKWTNYPVRY